MSNPFNEKQPPVSTVLRREGRRFDLVGTFRGDKSLWQSTCPKCNGGYLVETLPTANPKALFCAGDHCGARKKSNGNAAEMLTVCERRTA